MMQTVAVLLVFFILLVMALGVYYVFQRSKIREKQAEYDDLDMMKKSQMLNFFPQLQCSFGNVVNPDCYDLEKVQKFVDSDPLNNYYYKTLLGTSKITLSRFILTNTQTGWDADPKWADGWVIYDNAKSDYTERKNVMLPISLYEPKENKYYFGMLKLEIYK